MTDKKEQKDPASQSVPPVKEEPSLQNEVKRNEDVPAIQNVAQLRNGIRGSGAPQA